MLFLTRRKGEAIDVFDKKGDVVMTIHVVDFLPNKVVRLGLNATMDYQFLRDNAKTRVPHMAAQDDSISTDTTSSNPTITYKRKRDAK